MSRSICANAAVYPASPAPSRSAEHVCGKRARTLKLKMSERLVGVRDRLGLKQRDVHDRKQLVSDWENPHKRHSPTAMQLMEQVADPLSRPYALEVIACVLEEAEREESDPRQLSLLDLIAND